MDPVLIGIISSLIASALFGIVLRIIQLTRMGELKDFLVLPPEGKELNTRFYKYFSRQIDKAKTEIIVTGEGFGYKGEDGPRLANNYHNSMYEALQRGVNIIRIQAGRTLHPRWAEKLKECVRDYPNKFHLYIVDNKEHQDVTSVCVIDGETNNSIVEFMLSAESYLEDSLINIASTAIFIHGQKELAGAMKLNIMKLKQSEKTKKCKTEDDIDEFIGSKKTY